MVWRYRTILGIYAGLQVSHLPYIRSVRVIEDAIIEKKENALINFDFSTPVFGLSSTRRPCFPISSSYLPHSDALLALASGCVLAIARSTKTIYASSASRLSLSVMGVELSIFNPDSLATRIGRSFSTIPVKWLLTS